MSSIVSECLDCSWLVDGTFGSWFPLAWWEELHEGPWGWYISLQSDSCLVNEDRLNCFVSVDRL